MNTRNRKCTPKLARGIVVAGCFTLGGFAFAQTASEPAPAGEVIQLQKLTVTTEIGKYAEPDTDTGTKTSTALRDIPMSISVMNQAFLADLRAERLSDVYQYVTGLSFNDTSNLGGFSIRGFEASSNLKNIQVDGMPGLGSRFSTPPTANLERVEVLKGPAALLYGYMEPGGLVNLVTKQPQARQKTEIFTSLKSYATDISKLGSDPGYTVMVDSTGAISKDKRWRYRMIVEYEDLESYRKNRFQRNFYIVPSLMYAWSPNTSLTLGAELLEEKRAADEGLVALLNRTDTLPTFDVVYQNKDDWQSDSGLTLSANFKHRFQNNWLLSVSGRKVDHSDSSHLLRSQTVVARTPITDSIVTRRVRIQENERNYAYVDATLQGEIETGKRKHRLLLGVTAGQDQNLFEQVAIGVGTTASLSVNVYNPALGAAYPSIPLGTIRDQRFNSLGFYGQAQVGLSDKLKGVVSVRHDRQDIDFKQQRPSVVDGSKSSATVPSFGLIFQPSDKLSFYASYAESFHPVINSFSQENINGVSGEWDPEMASQMEAGIKFDFPQQGLTLTAAVFEITKDNIIEDTGLSTPANTPGATYWVVVGSIKSQGGEIDLQYRPRPHIQFRGGYAYTDAAVSASRTLANIGAPARNVPVHSANFWARYNVPSGPIKGLGFGTGVIYQSERLGVTTNDPALQFKLGSYYKMDTALYYNWRNYSFSLNVKNLFDKRYLPGGGTGTTAGNVRIQPGEPRQVIASVRLTF